MLDDVERRYPAERYVMVDDKLRILDRDEEGVGRPADDGVRAAGTLRARIRRRSLAYPAADVTIERIGELVDQSLG